MLGRLLGLARCGNTVRVSEHECGTPTHSAKNTHRLKKHAEKILLGEYDFALAEFDRVKHEPCSTQELRFVYRRYMDAISRLTALLGKGEIPAGVSAQIESS